MCDSGNQLDTRLPEIGRALTGFHRAGAHAWRQELIQSVEAAVLHDSADLPHRFFPGLVKWASAVVLADFVAYDAALPALVRLHDLDDVVDRHARGVDAELPAPLASADGPQPTLTFERLQCLGGVGR